jgi:Cof subfamily protein (haloacid dehalogenase superfamily)
MKYKLIVCDLDGTLLDSNASLSQENYDAITELSEMGIIFVPNTGRSFNEAPACVREHPAIKYFISSNGSVVQDIKNGIISQILIPAESVKEINKMARKCQLLCTNHKDNRTLTNKLLMNDDAMREHHISDYFRNQIYTCTTPIDDFYDYFDNSGPCEMVAGCFKNDELKRKFFDVVGKIPNLRVTETGNCIEIVSAFAGKDTGVRKLIEVLGIDVNEIITIGDGENDYNMMKMTPNSVAVSNASEALKNVAGRIGCSSSEHIVKYVLENMIK